MKLKENIKLFIMKDTDTAWLEFINGGIIEGKKIIKEKKVSPKCSAIYISTQTKIGYLNQNKIDLQRIFWEIKTIPYQKKEEGVIKKQMKCVCNTDKETQELEQKIKNEKCIYVDIISKVNNPNARKIKYKDVRKINVGLCKKDLTSHRIKRKGAFYNCIVLIIRLKIEEKFKEFHIKVFNTGKLEIPGIQKNENLFVLLKKLVEILQPHLQTEVKFLKEKIQTVLINSNFTCGFYINRNKLYNLLKYKYKIHSIFDSCSYPGIQCKFYYNTINKDNNGICSCPKKCTKKGNGNGLNKCMETSFMIFRTGSVLIVGNCTENILMIIYNFIKNLLIKECEIIKISYVEKEKPKKRKKLRKKFIYTNK